MSNEPRITAKITDAFWYGGALAGFIWNDAKGRFKDGDMVITSMVITNFSHTIGEIYYTQNSVYLVEFSKSPETVKAAFGLP